MRRFQFVHLWGIAVFFLYPPRQMDCPECVRVEWVPWAQGKSHLTTTCAWFLAGWSKRLSWKEMAEVYRTSWDSVIRSVKMAAAWGLEHRNLDGVTAIGIDEIARGKGQNKYVTLAHQIDADSNRLLWIGEERTQKTLIRLRFVCSDMWKSYLRVQKAGQAMHILDRFHIMSHMSKAVDKIRATEVKDLKAKGKSPVLTGTRWCLLKRP